MLHWILNAVKNYVIKAALKADKTTRQKMSTNANFQKNLLEWKYKKKVLNSMVIHKTWHSLRNYCRIPLHRRPNYKQKICKYVPINHSLDWPSHIIKSVVLLNFCLHTPYARHHNPLLIINCSWILTVHKDKFLRKKLLKKSEAWKTFLTSKMG